MWPACKWKVSVSIILILFLLNYLLCLQAVLENPIKSQKNNIIPLMVKFYTASFGSGLKNNCLFMFHVHVLLVLINKF